jgi:hypothetical protein
MTQQNPVLVSAAGLWYAYFTPQQSHPGDGDIRPLELQQIGTLGNASLFTAADHGMALTHRCVINVDVHASCEHTVLVERTLMVQVDKGDAGGLMPRGQSIFVAGEGNSAYQGLLEEGHIVRAAVSAPGDQINVTDGYISVQAQPV